MIDILIVDDNPVVRAALRGFLTGSDQTRVVGEAGDGATALGLAQRLRPTVTLLDYRMPIADGLSVVSALSAYSAVLVLTSDESDDLVTGMLRGGARGYLVHGQFDPPDLLRAVRAVANGSGWLSPQAASAAASALRSGGPAAPPATGPGPGSGSGPRPGPAVDRAAYGLTAREQDVLNLLSLGLSNAAIGHHLFLTEKTVKNHLNHAFAKLGVTSRTEALLRWTRP